MWSAKHGDFWVFPICQVVHLHFCLFFQLIYSTYAYIQGFFSCFPPFCRVADTVFNTVSVRLCTITSFYKQKQKFMTSSALTLLIVLFLMLSTFLSLHAAICCLPLVNEGHWAGDIRHLHHVRQSCQLEHF